MGILDAISGMFSDAKDLASEAIEDVDKLNALTAKIDQIKQEVYITELQTHTVPWVDALHKMSRPLISMTTIIVAAVVIAIHPDMDISKLLTVISGGSIPATAYTLIKGRGK